MAEPPHILIALHQLGGGGVERVTLHLANGLAKRGNRVSLVLLRRGGVLEDRVSPDVDLIGIGGEGPKTRGIGLLRAVGPLSRIIRAARPDVLLSPGNHMHPLVLLAHRRAALPGCRLALKFTNPVQRANTGRLRNAIRAGFFQHAASRADVLLALSDASRREAIKLAPDTADKLRVVDNPYVDERLLGRKRRSPAKVDPPLLLSVGRMIEQKDPLMLLEALAGLADRPWRLAMLGDGPLRQACEQRAEALGIAGRVEFPGFQPDPAPWFDRARLFLLPSRYEELPAVLFEAMVGRCSIVSTAASASVVELLDQGRLGRIVPPGDVDAFRAAVAEALDDHDAPPDPGPWMRRFTFANGVASHAEALGLR